MLEAWRSAGQPPMIIAGSTIGLQDRVIHETGGGIGRHVPLKVAGVPKGMQRIGGGYGEQQGIGREIYRNVPAAEAPAVIERMLRAYLAERSELDRLIERRISAATVWSPGPPTRS